MKNFACILFLFWLPGLLLGQAQQGTLLGHWDDPTVIGSSSYNNRYNEVWSVAVNGHEYGIIGSTKGTHFVDVTDPAHPFEADFIPGKAQGADIIHRDFKTYKHYIYGVCDEGASSLQIMDISTLPDSVRLVSNSNAIIVTAHNISIDTSRGLLYAWVFGGGGVYGYGGMAVLDLANPEHPAFIKRFNDVGAFHFGHIHDGFADKDTVYLDAGSNGFAMADFSNPFEPVLLGAMTNYAGQGYNHSGWPSLDRKYYFMADEDHGSPLKTVDVQNLEDIKVVDSYNAESTAGQIPHNPLVACNYLYVSYYYDGLQVYDISDPVNVQRILYYDTSTEFNDYSYKGAWGVNPFLPSGNILVADMQNGLFIIQGIGDNCTSPASKTKAPVKQKLSFQVTPQPASDALRVTWSDNAGSSAATVTLFDVKMTPVLVQNIDNQNVELQLPSVLANGMYFLKIQTERGTAMQKVLVQH